jgi:hypothetical protein
VNQDEEGCHQGAEGREKAQPALRMIGMAEVVRIEDVGREQDDAEREGHAATRDIDERQAGDQLKDLEILFDITGHLSGDGISCSLAEVSAEPPFP